MTEALRRALEDGPSLYRLEKDLGIDHRSLGRFRSGESSLRLDLADRLASHLGVEVGSPKASRKQNDG